MSKSPLYTDIADRYGAACPCGGTILRVVIDSEDVRMEVYCYGCGKTERRRFDWSRWGYMDRDIATRAMTVMEAFGNLEPAAARPLK